MKFCSRFNRNDSTYEKMDEVIIIYDLNDTNFKRNAATYMEKHPNQMVVFDCSSIAYDDFGFEFDYKFFNAVKEKYNCDFKVMIPYFCDISGLRQNGVKFFFNGVVTSFEGLYQYMTKGPSDIYIANGICFELPAVKEIAKLNNITLRYIIDHPERMENSIKGFFIRPEDIDLYSQYIDVFEFQTERVSVLYDVYANKKEWFGKLNEILALESEIDNRCIVDYFAERRIDCGRRCLRLKPCNICERCEELAKTMIDHHIIVTHDK